MKIALCPLRAPQRATRIVRHDGCDQESISFLSVSSNAIPLSSLRDLYSLVGFWRLGVNVNVNRNTADQAKPLVAISTPAIRRRVWSLNGMRVDGYAILALALSDAKSGAYHLGEWVERGVPRSTLAGPRQYSNSLVGELIKELVNDACLAQSGFTNNFKVGAPPSAINYGLNRAAELV